MYEAPCNDGDIDASQEEDDTEEKEQCCSCGYYCFDCLGMSWQDFM